MQSKNAGTDVKPDGELAVKKSEPIENGDWGCDMRFSRPPSRSD